MMGVMKKPMIDWAAAGKEKNTRVWSMVIKI
jgi:hypothetical protein